MSQWIGKAPHACFTAEFPPPWIAREEISRVLENHLCARFGAVRRGVFWRWPLRLPRMLNFHVEKQSVFVSWHTNRFKKGRWILVVAPGDSPLWARARKPSAHSKELMLACSDIHAVLISATGISNIMWYFDKFRLQGRKAVWTPDELPWLEI